MIHEYKEEECKQFFFAKYKPLQYEIFANRSTLNIKGGKITIIQRNEKWPS